MIAIAEFARGELPPTATYSRRAWQWLPGPGEDRDGTLVIQLTHGRRVVKTEFFYYAVQVEWAECLECGVWSFLLENEREPDEFGPFRCIVGGMSAWCGCERGRVQSGRGEPADCKHADSLAALVEGGVLG